MTLSIAPRTENALPAVEPARIIRGIKPYQAVSSLNLIRAQPDRTAYKIDWNESTVLPSPNVAQAITGFLSENLHVNLYPVLDSANLIEKLSRFYAIPEENLLVTAGSDEALNAICTTYINAGDPVLVPSPTYEHFVLFAQIRGARIVRWYAEDPFKSDLEGLLAQVKRIQPRMVYLVCPNNPTGVMYRPDEIAQLLQAAPETLFIVDEAYGEFARATALELLRDYKNLVITRTFSKAYGLAGLRIGYMFADAALIRDIHRVVSPKSVGILSQLGAIAALEDQDHLNRFVDAVEQSKVQIAVWAEKHGIECHITPANFVMMRFEQAPWVVRQLAEEGIYVRDRSSMEKLQGFVRFSVGTPEQTDGILRGLESVLRGIGQLEL